ncbi:nucleotidyltransferase domain-containing protein [bacterium]|nr:nucleotidyltransferase domain-containing protein [bacterium]
MKIDGINENEQVIILDILNKYKDYSFYYYGSRVKGTFEKTSDLDILIKGQNEMPVSVLVELKFAFDNSSLPYIVNFTDYNKIDKTFYELIEKDLIPIN